MLNVKDFTYPNVTITSPLMNSTISGNNFSINWTTTETANCYFFLENYDLFNSWNCGGWNSTNATNSSSANYYNWTESCNTTKYTLSGPTRYDEYVSKNYYNAYNGSQSIYNSALTGLITDGTSHGYIFNTTNKVSNTNITAQHYGLIVYCYDSDWNSATGYVAFKINRTE